MGAGKRISIFPLTMNVPCGDTKEARLLLFIRFGPAPDPKFQKERAEGIDRCRVPIQNRA